ncbi:hypothetical protein CEXT_632771 [Caerostris extrusa]|uniref:Uncharacterized protein n=1 Tax=Caerostris extrusa TaxID=172846 RepID=A0AAV4MGL2_CAEEX|nr:hypothetical protein CEXT_632771 [Caerostris extrusa]
MNLLPVTDARPSINKQNRQKKKNRKKGRFPNCISNPISEPGLRVAPRFGSFHFGTLHSDIKRVGEEFFEGNFQFNIPASQMHAERISSSSSSSSSCSSSSSSSSSISCSSCSSSSSSDKNRIEGES